MSKLSFKLSWLPLLALLFSGPGFAQDQVTGRFLWMGDGVLVLNQETITFRAADGTYTDQGLKRIHQIFHANWVQPEERLSLRFIEILDYVQDQLQGKSYTLKSGYRNPVFNQSLRNRGKLAAQSSMHVEGAAADMMLGGVGSSQVFDFVKTLDCCGIGWYHSKHFHIDTGPSRYWDETSSKTEDKTPQQNEKIILQSDYDIYRPGETAQLKFMRVTEYPIGVAPQVNLVSLDSKRDPESLSLISDLTADASGCLIFEDRKPARRLQVKLPEKKLSAGSYGLQVKFCNRFGYEKMPEEIISRSFRIKP